MDKCENCPLLNSDKVCESQTLGNNHFCQRVDPTSPLYNVKFVNYILRGPTIQQLPAKVSSPDFKQPNILQKAINFAGALVKHAAAGFVEVTPEQQKIRLDICNTCEFKTPQGNVPAEQCICGKCGCPLFKKTAWATSKCPIDKWRAVESGPEPPTQLTGENEINMNQPSPCNCGK
jgi:hypothetical protein